MSSMENATKNCGEVLQGLNLLYNRQRQAAITTELSKLYFSISNPFFQDSFLTLFLLFS